MTAGLMDAAARPTAPDDRRIYGVAVAEVIENCDQTNLGRVRVRLPWLPGYEPWARVAAPMAGTNSGAYFMPQVGDEVLVAFNHGDVLDVYVVGSMWNGRNRTPVPQAGDAQTKWVMRTPKGHQLLFDEAAQSIEITNATGQRVKLESQQIQIAVDDSDTAVITLDTQGNVTLKAKQSLILEADSIELKAASRILIRTVTGPKLGSGTIEIDGGGLCSINADQIDIG
jgi:uncharacterized protein involved in type VI secretion and phage assembly